MRSSAKHAEAPIASEGGLRFAAAGERPDPYQALDEPMVAVEALCPRWPERPNFPSNAGFLLLGGVREAQACEFGNTERDHEQHRHIKGQITIPKAMRGHLNLAAGDKVAFAYLKDGGIRIERVGRAKTRSRVFSWAQWFMITLATGYGSLTPHEREHGHGRAE